MQYKKLILSVLSLISFLPIALAQRPEIGVNFGGSGYIGDFNQFNPVKLSGQNFGVFGKMNLDPHWGIGIHINRGIIEGNDANSKNEELVQRNLNFQTTLTEIAFIGSFNFLDMYSPGSRRRVTPYLFTGVGGVIFNSKGTYIDPINNVENIFELRKLNTEDLPSLYKNYSIVIPYGAGVKYKKSENWTIFGQLGYRTTFTDYLDDVSGVYPVVDKFWGGVNVSDRSVEFGPKLYGPGDQRGDFRKRDTYLFVNIGISYTFVSQKCFTF
ncbi:DUF6089 family protein [Pedobacter sp. Du54]|uniref:type IX secretion system protein PorG n=1 Tax=Pedobacter anseongensis TaxID=3133439 RepID=UPI0030A83294